jgi:hypothetical protein
MTAETRNSNIISPENSHAKAKNAENQLALKKDEIEDIKKLSPGDQKQAKEIEYQLSIHLRN